ncbi:MAG: hypothetical protein ACMX3H_13390 [Sodalis sp. (in: enterobacteria)]|uniref:hypothetical protein n=1 Tax=Sodalis sp. (in: enterobacteria) TaxID=1898979 RepID=UPI0039E24466
MAIMAAGMHDTGLAALIVERVFFVYGQGIHIRAQPDSAVGVPESQYADNPLARDTGSDVIAIFVEQLRNRGGGMMLCKRQLRVLVEPAPQRGQFGVPRREVGKLDAKGVFILQSFLLFAHLKRGPIGSQRR